MLEFFYSMPCSLAIIITLLTPLVIGFFGAPIWVWGLVTGLFMIGWGLPLWSGIVAAVFLASFTIPPIRKILFTGPMLKILRALKIMPELSETEKVALEAGSVWMDGELFSGNPDFKKILDQRFDKLSGEEKSFIDNECEEICNMLSDWEVFQDKDLPPKVWDYLKKKKFLGMIVPKEYGGLGFSALANSAVVQKLGSHSVPLSICVMVPNSLGPAELLSHYGTKEQKEKFLPKLAVGEEVPCFALTEPHAGSDAGSIESSGVVFKDENGEIKIRLNWNKRYITLAAVSTIIGLAIQLRDPDNLLGKGEDLGITCMLIPSNSKGVTLGKRHNPMGVPFYNCPLQGKDVIASVDDIIGGKDGAGRGWIMLMECLATGRAISLPAQNAGGIKKAMRTASAYVNIRKQFGLEIGKFEGVGEPLARIGGLTYLTEAMRNYTVGAVDSGIKPAVVSAIAKLQATELARIVSVDAMDILGGAGISRGPRNNIANTYIAQPIGVTVEGGNILTITMIVFGQGAIRCHPYAYLEFKSVSENDLGTFDKAFAGHIGHVVRNKCRAILLSATRGRLASSPVSGPTAVYYKKLSWASSVFALLADTAMGTFGGKLKMKESLTGKFADIFSFMYIASCVLRKYEADGRPSHHWPLVEWSLQYSMHRIQQGFEGVLENFDFPVVGWYFRNVVSFIVRLNRFGGPPRDVVSQAVVKEIMRVGGARDDLAEGMFISKDPEEALGRYENAVNLIEKAKPHYSLLRKAISYY